jgi:dipeptidyl aminopeptidase/acylaminoacyl peptidase
MNALTRFWFSVGGIVLVNCLLIGAVLSHGDHTDLRPSEITPDNGATGIGGKPTIQVSYPKSIDAASLRTAFRMEPAVAGDVETNDRGLSYRVTEALRPGATYTVVIGPGVRQVDGRVSRSEVRSTLQARPSSLIVVRRAGGLHSVWSVDPGDGPDRRITGANEDVQLAGASPSGAMLAFVTDSGDNAHWSLWSVGLDDTATKSLVADQDGSLASLAWSPASDAIAFESAQTFGTSVSAPRLWLASVGSGDDALVYGRGAETGSRPSWSPDGRRLAFYENSQRVIGIYDFTSNIQTVQSQVAATVSWSPDSGRFVYVDRGGDDNPRTNLHIASLDGSSSAPMTNDELASDSFPVWSPDGTWIAFTRLKGTAAGLWLAHPDGSDAHPVQMAEGWVYSAPVWAPDGSELAFSRRAALAGSSESDDELWVAATNGKPRQLSSGGSTVAWIP